MTESGKPKSRLRRAGRGLFFALFPSFLISRWAERKHKEIKNPALAKAVESLTYRKAYGIDEIKERTERMASMRERSKAVLKERSAHLSDAEAYEAMMARNGFTEEDRARGMANLKKEIRGWQIALAISVALVLCAAVLWGWLQMSMAFVAVAFCWIRGTIAAFYLWQTEQRQCGSLRRFVREGAGLWRIFEW